MQVGQLIGPLTAEEWCSLRLGTEDDPLQCCAETSEFRDALFDLLRMGGGKDQIWVIRRAWATMDHHGWPDGAPVIDKIRAYYGTEMSDSG